MKHRRLLNFVLLLVALASASRAAACATCFGKSDSALAEGMNWGIFAMLGFIGIVLAGVAGAAIFFIRRGARFAAESQANPVSPTKI